MPADIENETRATSDHGYGEHVRDVGADTPARFNADPGRLFEASGNAGRIILFAVRLDTFAKAAESATFYIGTNDPTEPSPTAHCRVLDPGNRLNPGIGQTSRAHG